MDVSQLRPEKPIAEMTDDEFDTWREKCRDALRGGMTAEQLNDAVGIENARASHERSAGIDDTIVLKIVTYMADLRANMNECTLAAATAIGMQLNGAPEETRIQAVEVFPTKLEGALTNLLMEPEIDKGLS